VLLAVSSSNILTISELKLFSFFLSFFFVVPLKKKKKSHPRATKTCNWHQRETNEVKYTNLQ